MAGKNGSKDRKVELYRLYEKRLSTSSGARIRRRGWLPYMPNTFFLAYTLGIITILTGPSGFLRFFICDLVFRFRIARRIVRSRLIVLMRQLMPC